MTTDPFRAYWNDTAAERDKAFWIEDETDPKLLDYLRKETCLERGVLDGLAFVERHGGLDGDALEIGAGAGWSTALLTRREGVRGVVAVDYSEHRVTRLAPLVFRQMGGSMDKVRFLKADIFSVDLPACGFDLVLFVQSLYMHHPLRAMTDLAHRVLRPGGKALVCCEDFLGEPGEPPFRDISGRYYYHSDEAYRQAFEAAGFQFHRQQLDYQFYPHPGEPRPVANYLALKG